MFLHEFLLFDDVLVNMFWLIKWSTMTRYGIPYCREIVHEVCGWGWYYNFAIFAQSCQFLFLQFPSWYFIIEYWKKAVMTLETTCTFAILIFGNGHTPYS